MQQSRSNISQLNSAQRAAVKQIDTPLLVLAGAGSGKTSVITQKIAWLINECQYPAQNIFAVTFTNKAAREMQARITPLINKSRKSRGPSVSTFHQLGLRILHAHTEDAGRKKGFSILDERDSAAILKDIMLNDSISDELLNLYQQQISNWKSHAIEPDEALLLAKSGPEQKLVEIYRRYQSALRSYNATDFDDLIALPVTLLKTNAEILQRWQRRVRYLLVDEYQDTNIGQYQLVKLLVGDSNGLCVVGDDDQSIYTWRGANPENLNQLSVDFPGLNIVKLEQNYRSTNTILNCANSLISNNSHLFEKKLWSEKGLGDPVHIERLPCDETESEYICSQILITRLNHRCQFKDMAVLVRSNFQAKILELKLQAQQVPYHITGGTSFFARNEIKDILAYLRLLSNPDDDNAFLRIVNTPRRKIGIQTLQALGDYAQQRSGNLLACISEIGIEHALSGAGLDRLRLFDSWLCQLRTQLEKNEDIIQVLRELIEDIDYESWLIQNSSSTKVAEKRLENVYFLLDQIKKEAMRIAEDDNELSNDAILERVVSKLLLRDLLDQQSEEEADNKVQIMTLHASKGLEFPHVFVMGFEEQILPHKNSIESGDVEEERRLAYVGITRAQRTLTMTMAKQRKQFGEKINCEPSRFLEELPSELLRRNGFGETLSEKEVEDHGQNALSNLKALFD